MLIEHFRNAYHKKEKVKIGNCEFYISGMYVDGFNSFDYFMNDKGKIIPTQVNKVTEHQCDVRLHHENPLSKIKDVYLQFTEYKEDNK